MATFDKPTLGNECIDESNVHDGNDGDSPIQVWVALLTKRFDYPPVHFFAIYPIGLLWVYCPIAMFGLQYPQTFRPPMDVD